MSTCTPFGTWNSGTFNTPWNTFSSPWSSFSTPWNAANWSPSAASCPWINQFGAPFNSFFNTPFNWTPSSPLSWTSALNTVGFPFPMQPFTGTTQPTTPSNFWNTSPTFHNWTSPFTSPYATVPFNCNTPFNSWNTPYSTFNTPFTGSAPFNQFNVPFNSQFSTPFSSYSTPFNQFNTPYNPHVNSQFNGQFPFSAGFQAYPFHGYQVQPQNGNIGINREAA